MAYKILTKNGVETTNIDGARENFFNTGMRNGVVQGVLNEGRFESNASNSIYLDSCELRIAGHRIVIDEPVYKTFSNTPNNDIRYSMVAQIVVTDNGDVAFSLFVQSVETVLIKDNLYATTTGQGTYQVEIGRFTLTTNGTIEDVVRTIDTITGATESIAGGINIGNVTTQKIDYKLDAEVDVNQRYDSEQKKTFTDFNFQLPLDFTDIESKANNAEQVADEAKTSANAAVDTANSANEKANTAESNSSVALTNSQSALTTAQNAVNIANTANTKSDEAVSTANEALERITGSLGTKVTIGGVVQETFNADTKADANSVPTKTSQLENDSNFLTSVPSEYVTETELTAKNYATKSEIPDISGKADLTNASQNITANDITLQGFSMFNYCADLGGRVATLETEYVTSINTWTYGKWYTFKSGLKVVIGSIPVNKYGNGYQTINYPTTFSSTESYALLFSPMVSRGAAIYGKEDNPSAKYTTGFQQYWNLGIGISHYDFMAIGT